MNTEEWNEHCLTVAADVINSFKEKNILLTLAGGALRDADHNKRISDLDFIATNTKELRDNGLYRFMKQSRVRKPTDLEQKYGFAPMLHDNTYGHPDVRSVFSGKKEGVEIQIIIINHDNVLEFIRNGFDVDLCKIYYDPVKNTVEKFPSYETSKKNRELVYRVSKRNAPSAHKTIAYHIPKMREKYPDYEVKVVYE